MPYWRLSNFYLFYFATLGALIPYWSLYLKHLGFSSLQIGELVALLMLTKVVSPNLWGWIADHSGRRMGVVRLGALLATLSFAGVFLGSGYGWLALVMFAFSFFWNAVLPQFEANTLSHLGEDTHRYSSVRLWGSVGFIVAVAALGPLLDRFGPTLLPPVLLSLFAAIFLSAMVAPESGPGPTHHAHQPLGGILRRPEVVALFTVCFLMQASHGPYYTFYTLYMEAYGHSRSVIGQLWALGVVAEVGIFMVMQRLVPRFGLQRLLLVSMVLAALRWAVTGLFPTWMSVMVAAQLLHAATFGIFHAVAIALVHRYFAGRHHGKGQALYSSISFGAGGALGSYYSGAVWDSLGPTTTYLSAAAMAAIGAWVTWRWIPREGHRSG